MAKLTAMQKLQESLSKKKTTAKGEEPKKPKAQASTDLFDFKTLFNDNSKPNVSKFSHEFDNKNLQEQILGTDYVGKIALLDEEGAISIEGINQIMQKAIYDAVSTSQNQMVDLLGTFEEHSLGAMEAHIDSFSENQRLASKEFSENNAMQAHAMLFREKLKTKYPDADSATLDDAVSEYIQSIEDDSTEASKTKAKEDEALPPETDWGAEFGIEPDAPPAPTEET